MMFMTALIWKTWKKPSANPSSEWRSTIYIPLLAEALGLPETFTCPQRSVAEGIEGLCMVLKRMSFPCRFSHMIYRFGRPVPVLSMVTNQVIDYIYQTHGHIVTQWNNLLLNPAVLQTYADAIVRKGAPLENCFGFVDGTVRPICRPNEHQSTVYNGHKRVHALKFQSVTIPNGLIANLYGPVGKKGIHLCNGLFPQYCPAYSIERSGNRTQSNSIHGLSSD